MTNDNLTRRTATAAYQGAMGTTLDFLKTEEAILSVARSDFGYTVAPNSGGFNTEVARETIRALAAKDGFAFPV